MATLKSVIEYVDEIKPNAFSNEAKTQWVNECEGLVQTEVLLLADAELISYSYNTDKDKELLVKHPHVKIYWAYLTAMIDFANGEYNKYQNTMQMFNAFFSEYMRWFALWYHPADTHGENDGEDGWRGYYISAYGLAVKHGYEGTESEWLESLYGEEVMLRYDGTADELQWKYKSAEQWDRLMDTEALRGEIVSQTLSAAQSAREKAESAQTAAESAAQSAGTSAQSASGSAQTASTAAQGASNDAALAASSAASAAASETSSAQSAQTATEKASTAQAAAQTAQSAKADAESAKAAAVTAGASAESANASAQSAKSDAESAKAAAQTAQSKAETANTSAQTAKTDAEAANTSAQSAKTAAESAKSAAAGSAQSAGASAQSAQASSKLSESWAVGGTGTRTGEDTNNARYWSEQAQNAAGGGVTSFNGRAGAVAPQKGDYTAAMVGADEQGMAAAVQDNLNAHAENTVMHISAAERTAWNGKQNALTFDTVPTEGSTNPVTSGGVKAALDDLPQPIIGTTPPTTSTVGVVGQEYIDTAAKLVYHCTAAAATGYTWEVYSAGRSSKVNLTLYASSWSTAKKYTVSNANITATSAVELLPRENNGITQAQLEALSGAMIVGGTQAAGSIQLVALGDVPTTDIPVTLIIRRDL